MAESGYWFSDVVMRVKIAIMDVKPLARAGSFTPTADPSQQDLNVCLGPPPLGLSHHTASGWARWASLLRLVSDTAPEGDVAIPSTQRGARTKKGQKLLSYSFLAGTP